jgi:hypothetical protein
MRARRAHLEAAGMLAPGQDTEELLLVEGRAPAAGSEIAKAGPEGPAFAASDEEPLLCPT